MKKRWMALALIVVLTIALLPGSALAQGERTIYVGAQGSDENDGLTADAPLLSLEAAFAAAQSGDTVQLLTDMTLTQAIAVDNAALNLNGKTLSVNIPDAKSAFVVTGSMTVKNGRIFGAGESADNRAFLGQPGSSIALDGATVSDFHSSGNGAAVMMESGTLTVTNSSLGYYDRETGARGGNESLGSGGAVYAKDSAITITGTNLFYNKSRDMTDAQNSYWFGGGALYLEGAATTATIEDNYFFACKTYDFGGAIHLDMVGSVRIANNRIQSGGAYNHRENSWSKVYSRGGDGGAIYSRLSGELTILGNTIAKNTVMGNGGGVYVIADASGKAYFDGNTISENDAAHRGGGLCLRMNKGSTLSITSGRIVDNTASEFGGGIDYTGHDMTPLQLQNVMITENTAARGAGVWGCPTSRTHSYATLGGAIYNNTAAGEASDYNNADGTHKLQAAGDEVRYEGKDTPDAFALQNNPPAENTTMTVVRRALGGGLMQWYSDEAKDRYEDGDAEADPDIYTNTDRSFGLHGILSEEHRALAAGEARLVISGNRSSRGGGIATNSPVEIGMDADVTVNVEKKWTGGDEHPDSVVIDLYRVNADDTQIKLDSDVELNAENNWRAAFTDLPSKYIDADGNEQPIRYLVRERELSGWAAQTDAQYDEATRTYTVTLTNEPTVSYRARKVWADDNDPQRPSETSVTLLKNGEAYGETVMLNAENNWECEWTALPKYDADGTLIEWTLTEAEVAGYTPEITLEDGVFTVTNTKNPPQPTPTPAPTNRPEELPQTGTTRYLAPLFASTGVLMLAAGLLVPRKKKHE